MDRLLFQKAVKIFISHVAILFLCANCTQPQQKVEDIGIPTIDIIGNISKAQKINLSTIASSIDYCILETNENFYIDGKRIYSSGEYFVVMSTTSDKHRCYVFEQKTGSFVRQISQIGQGPNDYQFAIKVLNSDEGQICLSGNNKLLFFNLDGTLSHKLNDFNPNVWKNFVAFKDLYVGYVVNRRGNSTIRIAFFDYNTGELIDSIPNYKFYQSKGSSSTNEFSFHKFNNNLYYKDIYCDTLYQIKDFSLESRYIFDTGGKFVPYEEQIEGRTDIQAAMEDRQNDRYEKYIVINELLEDANYLYFTFDYRNTLYPALFNKKNEKLNIMPPISLPLSYTRFGRECLPPYGFENDLDGGLPFWPQQMISEKEMMCIYSVKELMELDTSKITNEKLKNALQNLNYDSSPVVAIVTLKD